MPPPSVYMTVSRSGQIFSPCIQMSSAVFATTVISAAPPAGAPVRSASRSSPWRKRAPPIPPDRTVIRRGRCGVSDVICPSYPFGEVVVNLGHIADVGLTSAVRQACNSPSVIHVVCSAPRSSEQSATPEDAARRVMGIRQGLTGRKGEDMRELFVLEDEIEE